MDWTNIIFGKYSGLLATSLIIFFTTFYFFIEKVENRNKKIVKEHDSALIKKYTGKTATIKGVIEIFDSLRENRSSDNKIKKAINILFFGGALFSIGCALGITLELLEYSEIVAVIIIAMGFLIFFIMFSYLLMWYRKNK